MTKEKQIEDMASIICRSSSSEGKCDTCGFFECKACSKFEEAVDLYNAGYRKQSVGEWENVLEEELYCPDIKATITRTTQTCSHCKTRIGFVGPKQYLFDNCCPYCGSKMKIS